MPLSYAALYQQCHLSTWLKSMMVPLNIHMHTHISTTTFINCRNVKAMNSKDGCYHEKNEQSTLEPANVLLTLIELWFIVDTLLKLKPYRKPTNAVSTHEQEDKKKTM